MNDRLLSLKETADTLGVSTWYLRRSKMLPVVKTDGGHRRYRESDVKALLGQQVTQKENNVVIYSRVSSQDQKQKGDLDRQKIRNYEYCVKQGYKVIETFEECGSGMNDNRTKLRKIIELAGQGKFQKLVVEHRDRLTRFGFGMFEHFFKQMGVEIVCVESVLPKSFENELVEDILSLLTVFSSKIYGRRAAENKKKRKNETQS